MYILSETELMLSITTERASNISFLIGSPKISQSVNIKYKSKPLDAVEN